MPDERSPPPGVPVGPFMHLAIAVDMSMAVVLAMLLSHRVLTSYVIVLRHCLTLGVLLHYLTPDVLRHCLTPGP